MQADGGYERVERREDNAQGRIEGRSQEAARTGEKSKKFRLQAENGGKRGG